MRILMVNYSEILQAGGVHTVIRKVCAQLAHRGHCCTVVSVNQANLPPIESVEGFTIVRVPSSISRWLYGFSPEVLAYLEEQLKGNLRPDVLHVHGYHSLITPSVILLAAKSGVPIVFSPYYSAHNTVLGRGFSVPYSIIAKRIFRCADAILCASETEAAALRRLDADPRKLMTVSLGVDRLPTGARHRAPRADRQLALLYVGWLLRYKGVQYMIGALKELEQRHGVSAKLQVVGDGPYKRKLERLATRLGVEADIDWSPPLAERDLRSAYAASDFLLSLSASEAYGLVVAEALTAGTPCVVSEASALKEFLSEPGCFGVRNPSEPTRLANVLATLSRRQIRVGPFSPKIKTWEEVAREYEAIYASCARRQRLSGAC